MAHIVSLVAVGCNTNLLVLRGTMEALLSVEEAARKLGGISKWTIHAWLAKGKLRRTKVGSRTMIRESELQRVICDEPREEEA